MGLRPRPMQPLHAPPPRYQIGEEFPPKSLINSYGWVIVPLAIIGALVLSHFLK